MRLIDVIMLMSFFGSLAVVVVFGMTRPLSDVEKVTMLVEECVNHQVLVKRGHDKFLRLNPTTMRPVKC